MSVLPSIFLAQKIVGISLTQSSVRAVCIDNKSQARSQAVVGLTGDTFSQDKIDVEALKAALKELMNQLQLKETYAAVTLPEYYSYTRSYQMPVVDLAEVREALGWQIEQILPLPKDNIYFDWKLIEQTPTQLGILVIAMPRKTLDTLIEAFESSGIKPVNFEPSALALTRVIAKKDQPNSILIEMNPHGSSATLVVDGVSRLTVTNQFKSSTNDEVSLALQKTGTSVQNLLNFAVKQHPQLDPSTINLYLTGESASAEVASWLSTLVNRQITLHELPQVQSQFSQAYAAATSQLLPQKDGYSVNLLPNALSDYYNAYKDYSLMATKAKMVAMFGIISLLISGIGLMWSFTRAQMADNQLQELANQNNEFALDPKEVVAVNQSSQSIVTLFPVKTLPIDQLVTVYGSKPEDVVITSLIYERDKTEIRLTGKAQQRASLLEFVNNLKDSDYFSQVNLPIDALEKPVDINFSLGIKVKP